MKMIHTRKSDYNFKEMTDEQVVVIAQEEQNEFAIDYIVNKYKNFVRAKARSYFLVGADREDIIQEGMIGLYKATRDFKHDKLASFRAFAELCITRQIITAIKSATRQKHAPLNSYISLNKPVYTEDSERTLIEMLSSTKITNPEDLIISQEELNDIERNIGHILSDLEWEVLEGYLDGRSYQEMAEVTDRSVKSIDNALQRVKRKLEKYLEHRVLGLASSITGRMTVVTNFLMIVEVIVSILLIVVVVAQNSKNAGMGGAVSGAADSSFGGKQRGLDAFLSKCTIILGIIFAVLSLVLGAMINQF